MSDRSDLREYWNERYEAAPDLWGSGPNATVESLTTGFQPGTALDLGCGNGRNAVWLATRGHRVTAVDVSDVAIDQAKRRAAAAGVDVVFEVADLAMWEPKPGAFDLVLLSYLQMPEPLRAAVHRKAVAALAPGGTLVLVAHHLDNLAEGVGGPQSPDVLFTERDLADDFAALDIDRNEILLRPVDRDGDMVHAVDVVLVGHRSK